MSKLPAPIEKLIEEFIRLPGIGRRGAERIVTQLLAWPAENVTRLSQVIGRLPGSIRSCATCCGWSEEETCPICSDVHRETGVVCVVERPTDLFAFEQSGAFDGLYHVLGGTLSPLGGITAEDLNIESLVHRIEKGGVREVILATSPTVEGDATALYLAGELRDFDIDVERIGLGLPLGASLGYADAGTLKLALEGRRKL